MRRLFVVIALAVVLPQPAVAGEALSGSRAVPLFASERILGQWVGSWFGSLPASAANPNECEAILFEALRQAGFVLPAAALSEAQQLEAKKLHPVFARYGDLSGMPNETVLRAGRAATEAPLVAVACGVAATVQRLRGEVCASAGCKAVDAGSKRRVATAVGRHCVAGADRATASIAAIREACRDAGGQLAPKLAERYGKVP